jgi:hypothetical protein
MPIVAKASTETFADWFDSIEYAYIFLVHLDFI